MKELDKEAILMNDNENKDITETESETMNTISIKSTVNPEKDINLNIAICENAEAKVVQIREELLAFLPSTASNEPSISSFIDSETLFLHLWHC